MSTIPKIGLGTSRNEDPEKCPESVENALEMGYRHLDTAQEYGNEALIGEGIAAADVPRDEIFLGCKVEQTNLAYEDVLSSVEESLEKLGTDYVDLLSVHWPFDAYDPEDTLPAFDELYDAGVARNIGVSNFTPDLLEEAQAVLDAPIVANQVEVHPMLPPRDDLKAYCDEHDITIVGYSPFCRGDAFERPQLHDVAEKHGVSVAQTILAWVLEKGVHPIPKAVSEEHLRDNIGALELDLDEEDVEHIDSMQKRMRKFDYYHAPWHQ